MSDPEYCYPPSYDVLRNKLGIRDANRLDYFEREIVAQRFAEKTPVGDFDLEHLRAIHRHLFQDIYEWAGEVRMVEITKGGSRFQFRQYIWTGMADIHKRLINANYLRRLTPEEFSHEAGKIMGDVNYVHPFREGNGRTQLLYLEQLSEQAGHPIDLRKLEPKSWIDASRESHAGDHGLMSQCIARAITAK